MTSAQLRLWTRPEHQFLLGVALFSAALVLEGGPSSSPQDSCSWQGLAATLGLPGFAFGVWDVNQGQRQGEQGPGACPSNPVPQQPPPPDTWPWWSLLEALCFPQSVLRGPLLSPDSCPASSTISPACLSLWAWSGRQRCLVWFPFSLDQSHVSDALSAPSSLPSR